MSRKPITYTVQIICKGDAHQTRVRYWRGVLNSPSPAKKAVKESGKPKAA